MPGARRAGRLYPDLPAVVVSVAAGEWVIAELDRDASFRVSGVLAEELHAVLDGEILGPHLRALGESHPLVGAARRLAGAAALPLDPGTALAMGGFDTLFLELTGACNENCLHCYAEAGPGVATALARSTCEAVLEEAAALGFCRVQLTGGEPLVVDFLDDLVALARRLEIEVVEIFTNGLLLTADRLARLEPNAPAFALSLYAAEPECHDRITGVSGSHAGTLAAIRLLVERGLPVRVAVLAMAQNEAKVEAAVALATDLGVAEVTAGGSRAVGRGERHDASAPCGLEPRAPRQRSGGRGSLCVSYGGAVYPCIFNRRDALGAVPAQRLRDIVAHPQLPGRGESADVALADCRARLPCLSCQATAFALRTAPCE